jgi:hypothetical protein
MKKVIVTIFLTGISVLAFSQEDESVLKKDIISADIGILSIWLNYERHLSGLFTLKSELGLGFGFEKGANIDGTNYFFTPNVIVEPRYYYNFNRRVEKGKKTSYNASNYFALTAQYFFKPFITTKTPDRTYHSGASLVPKWGIKRTIGQRFNFEFAFGAGLQFSKVATNAEFGLDLRFGYNIK